MTLLLDILLAGAIGFWVLLAVVGVLQNRRHARLFSNRAPSGSQDFHPPAVIIMPIKGIDRDLPGCIAGLCNQRYPDYRVIIVLESEDDPAFPVVQGELAKHPGREAQVMIAGQAGPNEGQKIHNQRHVLQRLLPTLDDDDIIAFADSDAIPGPQWLMNMIARLATPRVGVTTGYRWMAPDPSKPVTLWSHLGSVINGSIASMHRPNDTDQAWGGAMAMRVSTARRGDLLGQLAGALTDDYPITRMCNQLGLIVRYVPRCLAATPVDFTLRSLWTFARRQYLITRIYVPSIFWFSFSMVTLWLIGLAAAVSAVIIGLHREAAWQWAAPLGAMIAVFLLNQLRARYRTATIRAAFGQEMVERLRTTLLIDRWLTPVWMLLHWLIILSALLGNRFTWRGYRYQLDGPRNVRRLET